MKYLIFIRKTQFCQKNQGGLDFSEKNSGFLSTLQPVKHMLFMVKNTLFMIPILLMVKNVIHGKTGYSW